MTAERLSNRAVIGRFYSAVPTMTGRALALKIGMVFNSDQASEEYAWLGATPALSEWKSGRVAHYLKENGLTITNVHYEATLAFAIKSFVREKWGQVQNRIDGLALKANTHWNKLASDLIAAGESSVCYDGQFFFDTDHVEGKSGTQSNDLSIDISALPASVHGTTTAPSIEEAAHVIQVLISQILGFKDDQGEPMNEDAMEFAIVVPQPLFTAFSNAATMAVFPNGGTNPVSNQAYTVTVWPDTRSSWTAKVAAFRTDGVDARALIFQEEGGIETSFLGDGSDHAFKEGEYLFGVDAWRGAGYGLWQHACLGTMT